jgi:hypothetical protein
VSKIADEIRFDVTFGKELLFAAETGLPSSKEFLVHLGVIEAGDRPAIQPESPRGEDQLCAL